MNIGIVGANGYGGVELLRLLQHHPFVKIKKIVSHSTQGNSITHIYPHLNNVYDMNLEAMNVPEIASNVDLLFFATPSGVSKEVIPQFLEQGITCIDLSGDFRLKNKGEYEKWYKQTHGTTAYLQSAVYGLSEVFREKIPEAKLISNPGCYPTAALLGLIPVLKAKMIDPNSIIIDGKSGVSGAGRNLSLGNAYAEINENVKAYKLAEHQHTPEIEQVINEISGENTNISFTTHLVPMTRGIMCTTYCQLTEKVTTEKLIDLYKSTYEQDYFIRIRPKGVWPATKEVYGSNFCDIGLVVDERTNRLIIVSVIDNLVKGAAGQAIQNMNLINGWDEKTSLQTVPIYP
ncbi:N-acetyl-gamma-glutamyl-phosphate reductase [Heyndrickxia sp. NPDC080065]|uniref:N-acetyl-gamma-glutamyl-phosphate reductase n=1 Tax=Heyndrickxia sp. NPDC080065 TaxID=3390568 RepID=UPI003D063680